MPVADRARHLSVIGVADDRLELLAPEALSALREARLVVGGRRHLALLEAWQKGRSAQWRPAQTFEITADIDSLMATISGALSAAAGPVCVLASGDPGFFGILRTLLRHVDGAQIEVLPAISSVAMAFARLALAWDDAVVVSAHGRPLECAVRIARTAPKVAVLTAPDATPEQLGAALLASGCTVDLAAVCSHLGSADERVQRLSLAELAQGSFEPLSVVILVGPGGLPLVGWSEAGPAGEPSSRRVLSWGRDEALYAHRTGMITKAETRSVVLGKLCLPERGVLWDVGAGSGSVAIECGLLRPGLVVFAVERNPEDARRITANAAAAGVTVHVVDGEAPGALETLPPPDRAFVGGGGPGVLDAVLDRLSPGGHVVASFASLDRAVAAAQRLGHLVQVRADRGERMADGTWRLVANNPVFVTWGPTDEPDAS